MPTTAVPIPLHGGMRARGLVVVVDKCTGKLRLSQAMRAITGFFVFGLSVAVLKLPVYADDDSWIADSNGCKVRNPKPVPNESVSWSGACKDGYAEGPGVVLWEHDGVRGFRLEATFVRGKANGEGSSLTGSGALFDGHFVDGEPSGKGALTWMNGDRYAGEWTHGKRTGVGVLTRANGNRYEGDFVDGKRSGKGVFTFGFGSRYEGEWVDDKREGRGTQVYDNGNRYEGEWKDDRPTQPELMVVRQTYSIKETLFGANIGHGIVKNIAVPVDKTYAELTEEEKQRVKSVYEPMAEGDEPPYPLHGLRTIVEASAKLQSALRVSGALTLAVTVSAAGEPIAVAVLKSPDEEMTKRMAAVLMLEKYKPAVCKGIPCQMQYPFRMNFTR